MAEEPPLPSVQVYRTNGATPEMLFLPPFMFRNNGSLPETTAAGAAATDNMSVSSLSLTDWESIMQSIEQRRAYWQHTSSSLLNYLISKRPPFHVLCWAVEHFQHQLLHYETCPHPHQQPHRPTIHAVPVSAACFYHLSDASFQLLLERTVQQQPKALAVTNLDLIPLHRLKILLHHFPNNLNYYSIDSFLDSPNNLQDLDKLEYILKCGLARKKQLPPRTLQLSLQQPYDDHHHHQQQQQNGNSPASSSTKPKPCPSSSFLLPHMFLTYILYGKLPKPTDSQNEFWRRVGLLMSAAHTIGKMASHPAIRPQFDQTDLAGNSCLCLVLNNLDYLFSNVSFDETWLLPLIQALLKANPKLATTPFPASQQQRQQPYRLPIHVAVERGHCFYHHLLMAAPETLCVQDPLTKLYPFQLAATSRCTHWYSRMTRDPSIEMIFTLLQKAPHLLMANMVDTSTDTMAPAAKQDGAGSDDDRKRKDDDGECSGGNDRHRKQVEEQARKEMALLDLELERTRRRHAEEIAMLKERRRRIQHTSISRKGN